MDQENGYSNAHELGGCLSLADDVNRLLEASQREGACKRTIKPDEEGT